MSLVTDVQKNICRNAAAAGLPFALWRSPHGDGFTLVASIKPPRKGPVFGGDAQPAFVMAPFATDDGNMAWHFDADILASDDRVRFWDGSGFWKRTVHPLQQEMVKGTTHKNFPMPSARGAPTASTDRATHEARVRRAVAAIVAGTCEKIVLARTEVRRMPKQTDLIEIVEALSFAHPHAFVSLVSSDVTGTWITATPEILLETRGGTTQTMALAGTQWPEPGTDLETLDWSDKIIREQALVAQYVRDALKAEGFRNVQETAPHTVQAANLCHLRSDFTVTGADPNALAGLLRRLHPTSAVCGMPKDTARAHILAEEGDTRGFYTGYLGPVGIDGQTTLYVNLRSAQCVGSKLYLHVGGGIVAGSDPALEWQETVEKTKTIAQVL